MNDSTSSCDTVLADQCIINIIEESTVTISKEQTSKLVEFMINMGAVCVEDMVYLTDKDLVPYLLPLQRRKLIHFIQKKMKDHCKPSSMPQNANDYEVPVLKSDALDYEFKEDALPTSILNYLKQKARLPPPDRRLLIKLIANDVLLKHNAPGRRLLRLVACKVVLKYPKSLADYGLNEKLLGDGCGSFVLQLENSISNSRRLGNKRPSDVSSSSSDGEIGIKRKKHTNMHLCVEQQFDSRSISADELESCRVALLTKFQLLDSSQVLDEEIKVLMNKCFSGIRTLINSQNKSVLDMCDDWPILFTKPGFSLHFQQLLGKRLELFYENLSNNLAKFLSYMQSLQLKKKEIKIVVKKINDGKQITKDDKPEILGMINLLCEYFHEDFNKILVKEGSADMPITPCIVAQGSSVYTATSFKVMVDGAVIFENVTSPVDALGLFFASFYIFNILYPAGNALTLEFLQWSVAEIHTLRGNHTEKSGKNKSRVNGVHAKVLSLLNSINDFSSFP